MKKDKVTGAILLPDDADMVPSNITWGELRLLLKLLNQKEMSRRLIDMDEAAPQRPPYFY